MWPFTQREQLPKPQWVKELLRRIPADFIDDGCSHAPDSWTGFDLRHACRIHDYDGCTRCHPPGSRTLLAMKQANSTLERVIAEALPFRWRWLKWPYYYAVKRLNGDVAWDSCGPEAGFLCRHNQRTPEWMKAA